MTNLKPLCGEQKRMGFNLNIADYVNDLGQHWFRYWLAVWRHQAITWTNVDLLSIEPSETIFSQILIEI